MIVFRLILFSRDGIVRCLLENKNFNSLCVCVEFDIFVWDKKRNCIVKNK